ncbi:MAG: hypothetical protein E7235_02455 [Lachnospiraceae bacterium]|nr:hypothetical protein [Lachnospiraceae bacterium]
MDWVILEKKGPIAVLTLNNPKKLNSLSSAFMKDIDKAIDEVEKDRSIFVLIITGVEKAFIAGADIEEMLPLTASESLFWGKEGADLNDKIEAMRVPVIAALNGFTLGGGNELAMACDIRIASEKAKFGQPEVGLGITPGAGGTQRLPRLVGLAKAKELLYTARVIGAEEALSIGLVNKVVPHEELMNEAMAMAEMICGNGQIAVQEVKKCINYGMQTDIATGVSYEQQSFAVTNSTEDKRNAMTAFVNKQKDKNFVYR